ncbi:MAG: septation protein IspZ [Alphaproteobacteria bacterium]|nr:inner membrane-spanning protein YciB [Alphaproteobacteria bacterium]TAD87973.1 MAG: septation protein IspZ [Alphaproteobacteria bacterium]
MTKPPAWAKTAADWVPLIAFFVVNKTHGFLPATAVLVAGSLAAAALLWVMERRLPIMALVTAGLVGLFGGLTLWFQDETFVKLKPTIAYLGLAAAVLGSLWLKRPLLRALLGGGMALTDEGWRLLSVRFGLFFLAMAGINEVVWRTQSTDLWVDFKVFGGIGLTILFIATQLPLIKRHAVEEVKSSNV